MLIRKSAPHTLSNTRPSQLSTNKIPIALPVTAVGGIMEKGLFEKKE